MKHFEILDQFEESIISIVNAKGNYIRVGDLYKIQKDCATMLWAEISSIQLKSGQWVIHLNHKDLPLHSSTILAKNIMFSIQHYEVRNIPICKSTNTPYYEIY